MKSTKDIRLAAAFLALGAKHESTDKTDPRHMEFFFSPKQLFETGVLSDSVSMTVANQDLNAIESAWTNKTLMVNAYEYADAFQRLKAIIHSR